MLCRPVSGSHSQPVAVSQFTVVRGLSAIGQSAIMSAAQPRNDMPQATNVHVHSPMVQEGQSGWGWRLLGWLRFGIGRRTQSVQQQLLIRADGTTHKIEKE